MGIGVVWVEPLLALGALALLLVNVVFINLSALLALLGFGYRPSEFSSLRGRLSLSPRTIVSAVATVGLVVLVVGMLFGTYQYFLFDQTVNRNVDEVLAEPEYSGLELASATAEFGAAGLLGEEGSVTVVAARTTGEPYPRLSTRLRRHITTETNRDVSVEVRFVEYQRAGSG